MKCTLKIQVLLIMAPSKKSVVAAASTVETTTVSEPTPSPDPVPVVKTRTRNSDTPRKVQPPMTLEEYDAAFDEVVNSVAAEIASRREAGETGGKFLLSLGKTLKQLHRRSHTLFSKKRRAANKDGAKHIGGFTRTVQISDELRKFLRLKDGETVCREDVTNAICAYVHINDERPKPSNVRWDFLNPKKADGTRTRNLQNPDQKNSILPDSVLSKLLRVEEYRQRVRDGQVVSKKKGVAVTDTNIYYYTLQALLSGHYTILSKEASSAPAAETPVAVTPSPAATTTRARKTAAK